MSDRLDWVEKAGIENMKAHHACADTLAKDAATTLTVLLAGMGGGLAYAVKAVESNSWNWLAAGAAAFTLWLIGASWYLTAKCLKMSPLPQIYNEPKNLNDPDEEFEYMRECELLSLQMRIEEAAQRNSILARNLNRTRTLAVLSPLVFIASSAGWMAAARFLVAA